MIPTPVFPIGDDIMSLRKSSRYSMFSLQHFSFLRSTFSTAIAFAEMEHYSRPIQMFVGKATSYYFGMFSLVTSNAQPSNKNSTLDVMLVNSNNKSMSDRFQHGQQSFYYSIPSGQKNCFSISFNRLMRDMPSVKIQPLFNNMNSSHVGESMATAWLTSVSRYGFSYCVHSLLPFMDLKHFTINYLAVSGPLSDNSTIIENHLVNVSQGNCVVKRFNHSPFNGRPYVFVTAQGSADEPLVAWVRSSSHSQVEVCLRSACNDMPSSHLSNSTTMINIIVRGKVDPCRSYTCPMSKQCRVGVDEKPFCSCIDACPAVSGQVICGSDHMTYMSACHLQVHNCKNNTNITKKHDGVCVRKY